jgi:hypothetical protein
MRSAKEFPLTGKADRYPGETTPHRKDRPEDAHGLAPPTRRAGGKRKPGSEAALGIEYRRLRSACLQPLPPDHDHPRPWHYSSSARQLTTRHCPAVPTRVSQSDQLSLPSRQPPDPSTPTTMTPNNTNYNRPLDTGVHLSS